MLQVVTRASCRTLTYKRWSTQAFTIATMTPIWIFPAYPLLLVGPFAGALTAATTPRLAVITSAVSCQGLGFLLSCMVYAAFLYRLMVHKLPTESTRPGMFVSVGPSGFTVSALLQLGARFPETVPPSFMGDSPLFGHVTRILATWAGIWLYGLAVWFFVVSVGAHASCVGDRRLTFAMTWYAFVFPNTSLATSTFNVARALGNVRPLEIVGCVLAGLLIVVWSCLLGMNVRAVALKQILWPFKGEDSEGHLAQRGTRTDEEAVVGDLRQVGTEAEGVAGVEVSGLRRERE